MTAVDSRARQSRPVTRADRVSAAPPGSPITIPAVPPAYGTVAGARTSRSSIIQAPSGSGVEKCTARVSLARTAAGRVPDVLTTTRSPGSSTFASSVNT